MVDGRGDSKHTLDQATLASSSIANPQANAARRISASVDRGRVNC